MKTQTLFRRPLWLAIVAAIAVAFASSVLAAEDEEDEDAASAAKLEELTTIRSTIEVGACYVSDDSFRFGRYNGLTDQGATPIVNIDILRRGPYDGDSAAYWSLTGSDLGFDSRSAHAEYGVQGSYRLHADYDQIPSNRSDETRTLYAGAGTDTLTLPSGWVGAQTTAGLTRLLPSLTGVELGTERRRTGVGVDAQFGPHWSFTSNFRHETKDGIKSLGAVFGNSGGNPRAVLIPEPVDYSTEQIDLAARYFAKKWQVQLAYYGSLFNDRNSFVSFQSPYTNINGWAAGSGFPTGIGQMSTPPDNQFHQLTLDGGYNFSDTTRLSASVARGRMTQDDPFLPYTANPTLAGSISQPLPRDSLDGRIDTTVATLRFSSRPWTNFYWNAQFRYDDRDNKTPVDRYVYIGGDTQTQTTAAISDRIRFNEPYSYTDEQFKLDAGYKVFRRTTLAVAAEHRKTDRTYAERERAEENLFRAEVRSEINDKLSGHLRWTRAERDGSTYHGNEPLETGFVPGFAATLNGGFEQQPALRKFNQADRTRDIGSAALSYTPIPALTLSVGVDYALDDYDSSEIGLTLARTRSHTGDVVWAPNEHWSAYAFYTYEKMDSNQDGQSVGGNTRLVDSTNPARSWFAFHRDTLDTAGVGVKHAFASKRLELGADYVHSWTRSDVELDAGTALAFRALPQAKTSFDSVSVNGSWQIRNDTTLKLRFWRERLRTTDWQIDSLVPNQLANVITIGERSPDYSVNVVFASVVYRF